VQIVGLGGVGKTQLAAEFCYRNYPNRFGLVVWLNAESAETIAAGLRKLALDTGIDIQGKPNSEVVDEVRSRLFQTRGAWLIVFDNLENPADIRGLTPQGNQLGHVLVTGQRRFPEWNDRNVTVGCFGPAESLLFLESAAGENAGIRQPCVSSPGGGLMSPPRVVREGPRFGGGSTGGGGGGGIGTGSATGGNGGNGVACGSGGLCAGEVLADHLGHLPLALAMATSYMRRCDVECIECV
jgi:hypothetical protein